MSKETDKMVGTLCMIAAFAGLAYGIYSMATYSGLYRWAAEWQMDHFGSYDVELTAIGLIFVLFLTPLVVMGVYLKGRPAEISNDVLTRVALGATAPTSGEGSKAALVCVVIGLLGIFVAGGAYRLGNAKSKQALTFEPLDLAEHRMPKTKYVEVKGVVQTGMTVEFTETTNGSKTVTEYLPLTPNGWKTSEPIVFFLRPHGNVIIANNQSYNFDTDTAPFEIKLPGVLFRNDLPGPVISQYEKHGVKIASPHMVLDTNTSAVLDIYWEVALISAIMGVVALITGGIMAYRNWKEAQG